MTLNEIECTLRELRLSGIAAAYSGERDRRFRINVTGRHAC